MFYAGKSSVPSNGELYVYCDHGTWKVVYEEEDMTAPSIWVREVFATNDDITKDNQSWRRVSTSQSLPSMQVINLIYKS